MSSPFSEKDSRKDYSYELLSAALSKTTETYGAFKLTYSILMNEERARYTMRTSDYGDIIQGVIRKEWESELIPIYIPILKGLMGKRIFLIRGGMQKKFSDINSLDQLKKIPVGAVHNWEITKVLSKRLGNCV